MAHAPTLRQPHVSRHPTFSRLIVLLDETPNSASEKALSRLMRLTPEHPPCTLLGGLDEHIVRQGLKLFK